MEESFRWGPTLQGVLEGRQHETGVEGRATGPTDDAPAPEVKDGGKLQPAFGRFEVGYIG